MDKTPQKMNFLYASDNNFILVLATSIYSLLAQHKDKQMCIYIILDKDVSDRNKKLLLDLGESFDQEVILLDMPDFDSIVSEKLDVKRYSASMFSRISSGTILPDSVERIIYLDCDTFITDDLSSLWHTDLKGRTMGAVDDNRSVYYSRNLGIKDDNSYFNSGVLLIDLKRYRDMNYEKIIFEKLSQLNGLLEFPDNDILCKVMQDDVVMLPLRYNLTSVARMCNYKELNLLRRPVHKLTEREYSDAMRNPAILHFTTFF